MTTGPLTTAESRFGSSTVTDGDSPDAPNWQPRNAAAAMSNTDVALWPARRVAPRQGTTSARSCHWPWGLSTATRLATAELRVSCGKTGVAHTSSNRNRGVAPPLIRPPDSAGEGQWYEAFSGIADEEIQAVSGILSHTVGQVSGSATAKPDDDTHAADTTPTISVADRTRRMPWTP